MRFWRLFITTALFSIIVRPIIHDDLWYILSGVPFGIALFFLDRKFKLGMTYEEINDKK